MRRNEQSREGKKPRAVPSLETNIHGKLVPPRRTRTQHREEIIADDVGSVCFGCNDICCFHLRATTSVSQFSPGYGASIVLCTQNRPTEHAIKNDPRNKRGNTLRRTFE